MIAEFKAGDVVWVDPVGVRAEIARVVPAWRFGTEEPINIFYDCGLGRLFSREELSPLPHRSSGPAGG